jgi:hypothetical protein
VPYELQKLVAKVGHGHWMLLTQGLGGDWTFLIWGRYPLSGNLGPVNEDEAKEKALFVAKEHLKQYGLLSELADLCELSWRVAVRYIAA